jgi:glycosyltransferase involved in cell wall biosynthesis
MKKIIISNYDDLYNPFYGGGGARAVHEVASRLKNKFEILVITSKYHNSKSGTIDGVLYKRIGVSFVGPRLSQLIFLLLLPYYVLASRFDVWIENFTPPIGSIFLNIFTRRPVIGLIHMLPAKDMERKYLLPFSLIQNIVVRLRKQFIVLTAESESSIRRINKKADIEIIPNGVSVPNTSSSRKKRHILFIGRIEYDQKGLDLLIEAYSKLNRKITPTLIIAGTGSENDEKKLKEKINTYHLDAKIKLVGRVSGTYRDLLFNQSIMCVCPSRFETQSLVALEAMSYGVPLICFNIDGLNWIPAEASLKADQFNTSQLAKLMKMVLASAKLRKKLITNGRKFAKLHSWDKSAIKYQNYIDRILNNE